MKILVTGTAGFIGFHLAKRLATMNENISCIDNINDYYDVDLKYDRLAALGINKSDIESSMNGDFIISNIFPFLNFAKVDICNMELISSIITKGSFDIIIHLAAQAGVRYSLVNPNSYISSNIQGFLNILEVLRQAKPKHFIYASSSSVYGMNTKTPFAENDTVNSPASLYAATKRSNELMAYTYSHLYNIPSTGLRFFTAYGPWGRPDMAPYIFTKSIMEGKPINVFNNGKMQRDFTYIDDIVESVIRIIDKIPVSKSLNQAPAAIYNIGNSKPIELMDFIRELELALNRKAIINYEPLQAGDVAVTWADCSALQSLIGFIPDTSLALGIEKFVDWHNEYYLRGK